MRKSDHVFLDGSDLFLSSFLRNLKVSRNDTCETNGKDQIYRAILGR